MIHGPERVGTRSGHTRGREHEHAGRGASTMEPIARILAGTDFSTPGEHACEIAFEWASRTDAECHIAHVVEHAVIHPKGAAACLTASASTFEHLPP